MVQALRRDGGDQIALLLQPFYDVQQMKFPRIAAQPNFAPIQRRRDRGIPPGTRRVGGG